MSRAALLAVVLASCARPALAPMSSLEDTDDATEFSADAPIIGSASLPAAHCTARGPLPDPVCTPRAVMTTDLNIICGQSTKERRNVPSSVHRAVFAAYGIPFPPKPGEYEVDHLVPLATGGSNDIANLWPEAAPEFHVKDVLENRLHKRVCSGELRIEDAQRAIATDWVSAARKEGLAPR
jgi:hypothetical protein